LTICIAALCDKGKNCVVGADREITVASHTLEFDHEKKIEALTDSCVIMAAGDSLFAAEIIEKTRQKVVAQSDKTIRVIAEDLRDIYKKLHLERAESVILHPRGLTLQEFLQYGAQRLPLQSYMSIDQQLFNFGLNVVEFLVAGTDSSGAHIYRVHYTGVGGGNWLEWCDRLGFRAIGTGALHAAILLSLGAQNREENTEKTIYNVYSAKKSAEVAPGVGPATDLAVISSSGIKFVTADTIKKLSDIRETINKRGQVNSEDIKGIL
jgi:20S proteasome alpha/beta subunit